MDLKNNMPNKKWEKNICKIKNTTPNSKKKRD